LVRIGISQPNPRSRKVAIYVIDEAIRFKSIIQIESEEKYKKSTKLGQKGSRDPLLEFWDPPPWTALPYGELFELEVCQTYLCN